MALETAFCSCLMILMAVSARVYTAAVAVATCWLMAVDCAADVPLPADSVPAAHQSSSKFVFGRQWLSDGYNIVFDRPRH